MAPSLQAGADPGFALGRAAGPGGAVLATEGAPIYFEGAVMSEKAPFRVSIASLLSESAPYLLIEG